MWYVDRLHNCFSFIGGEFIIAESERITATGSYHEYTSCQMNMYSVESTLSAEAVVEAGFGVFKHTNRYVQEVDIANYVYTPSSNPTAQELLLQIEQKIIDVPIEYKTIPGCRNSEAINYNPYATVEGNTCIVPFENCIPIVTAIGICPPNSESYTADCCNKLTEEEFNSYTWTQALHDNPLDADGNPNALGLQQNEESTLYFTEVLYGTAINGITYDEIDGCTYHENIHRRGGFLYYYHSGQTGLWFKRMRDDHYSSDGEFPNNFSLPLRLKNLSGDYIVFEQNNIGLIETSSSSCYMGNITIGDTSNCFLGPNANINNISGNIPIGLDYTLECPEKNYLTLYMQNPDYWEDIYLNQNTRIIKTSQEIHYTSGGMYYTNDGYSYTGLYTESSDGTIFSGIGSSPGNILSKKDKNNLTTIKAKNFNKIKKSIENICKFVKL